MCTGLLFVDDAYYNPVLHLSSFYKTKIVFGSCEKFLDAVIVYLKDFEDWPTLKLQLKYIKKAQSLPQYGVKYFLGVNKAKMKVHLGVRGDGLGVYPIDSKRCPKSLLLWEHIESLQVDKNKFIIKCSTRLLPSVSLGY